MGLTSFVSKIFVLKFIVADTQLYITSAVVFAMSVLDWLSPGVRSLIPMSSILPIERCAKLLTTHLRWESKTKMGRENDDSVRN